jgi:hypothetical protein
MTTSDDKSPLQQVDLSHLVFPHQSWGEDDYASLQARLEFYPEAPVLTKFRQGEVTRQYPVDPLDTAAALAGGHPARSGLLPEGCLYWGRMAGEIALAIYLEPRVRTVKIHGEPSAWRVPLPGLVFRGHMYEYRLWAVKERPAAGATLYRAPCPGVDDDAVCRGVALPPLSVSAVIDRAVGVFFSTPFEAGPAEGKSRAYPENILEQWRALHLAGAQSYPADDLVEAGKQFGPPQTGISSAQIAACLAELPPARLKEALSLVEEILPGGQLSAKQLLEQAPRIERAVALVDRLSGQSKEVVLRCLQLMAVPGPTVPLGF